MHFIGSKFWSLSLKLGPRSQRLKWRLFSPGVIDFKEPFGISMIDAREVNQRVQLVQF